MIIPREMNLIDRDELIEVLFRSDCSSREKVADIVYSQPVIAKAKTRFELEMCV